MKNHILTVKDLNVYYKEGNRGSIGRNRKKHVVKDVSFQLKRGEVLGIVGESGSGKSTLVKALLGLSKDYTGEIIHESQRPQMIFQDPYSSLNPAKTVGWILEEALRLKGGYKPDERHALMSTMLTKVGLEDGFKDRFPRELSGGQRQRVCIASALMQSPELLIADEPVSALDVTIQEQIINLLMDLHKEMNLSILFISHDLRVVYRMCEQIMIMHNGTIIEAGSRDAIYFHPKQEYTKSLLRAAGIETKE